MISGLHKDDRWWGGGDSWRLLVVCLACSTLPGAITAPLFQVPGRKPFDGGAQGVVLAPPADAYVRSLHLFLLPEVVWYRTLGSKRGGCCGRCSSSQPVRCTEKRQGGNGAGCCERIFQRGECVEMATECHHRLRTTFLLACL